MMFKTPVEETHFSISLCFRSEASGARTTEAHHTVFSIIFGRFLVLHPSKIEGHPSIHILISHQDIDIWRQMVQSMIYTFILLIPLKLLKPLVLWFCQNDFRRSFLMRFVAIFMAMCSSSVLFPPAILQQYTPPVSLRSVMEIRFARIFKMVFIILIEQRFRSRFSLAAFPLPCRTLWNIFSSRKTPPISRFSFLGLTWLRHCIIYNIWILRLFLLSGYGQMRAKGDN